MEMAVELEDDLFFADLSKQISLLIMDDDNDDDPLIRYPSVSFQGFTGANHPTAQSPFMQEQMFRRESKGTGVFIPKSSQQPRRKHGGGRYSSSLSSNPNRQLHQTTTTMASQPSFSNSFKPRKG
ncbi:hypothetical protein F3Y22_tig00113124pilonHSYRG00165 [Hibiscus syriacus]|uniref:Uncharacterized protein n=1 Tax=Hibiscus syriacus TaxID=106335 RepID=A0A6A2WRH4_HIBSY|nr:uncharacterized protein LOC120185711 [Hibiscus syriacus]KAE8662831.1 hypothetical protein F3Y22_tig00113124pilonHSYRG00165 [Hibiscus syriacus]